MAAAFSFGFAGDDIDNDDTAKADGAPNAHQSATIHTTSLSTKYHSLDDLAGAFSAMTTGNEHVFCQSVADVQLFLSTLPSYLSYNYLDIPSLGNDACGSFSAQFGQKPPPTNARAFTLPRRSSHDIRTQLMAESTLGENGHEELISGLDTGDLNLGYYEGGFKTWECAIDLAAFVTKNVTLTEDQDWHVIELGAGSGIPSLAILRDALSTTRLGHKSVKFTFCDYNEEVLKLVTMPNVLLSWWEFCAKRDGISTQKDPSGEAGLEDIDENMSHRLKTDCTSKRVSFDFISGAWGTSFVDLIRRSSMSEAAVPTSQRRVIILASETIYSPVSLTSFVATVVDLLRATNSEGTAFIAAKRIYFGVGGGVQEFEQEMGKVGGSFKEIINITDSGVGRVILEVSLA